MNKCRTALRSLLLVFFFCSVMPAQGLINPGIKLGYTFGPNGGFVYGIEVSYTAYMQNNGIGGLVVDVERCNNMTMMHFGFEGSYTGFELNSIPYPGICVGPSLIWDDKQPAELAFSIIPFFGFMALPYFEYTIRREKPNLTQTGIYFKVPVSPAGGPIWDWNFR